MGAKEYCEKAKGVCVCVCGEVEGRVGGEAEGVIVVGQRGLDRGRKKKDDID